MLGCAAQLGIAGGFALRATYPLAGKDVPAEPVLDADAGALDAWLERAAVLVSALEPGDFERAEARRITHVAGEADLVQDGRAYLSLFALPNLWFHLSMAYAIARSGGLAIGKADFDGLHAYSPGVSFVER